MEINNILKKYKFKNPQPDIDKAKEEIEKKEITVINDKGTNRYIIIIKDTKSNLNFILIEKSNNNRKNKDIKIEKEIILPFLKKYHHNIYVEMFAEKIINRNYKLFYNEIKNKIINLTKKEITCINEIEDFFLKGLLPSDNCKNIINDLIEDKLLDSLTLNTTNRIIKEIVQELKEK